MAPVENIDAVPRLQQDRNGLDLFYAYSVVTRR